MSFFQNYKIPTGLNCQMQNLLKLSVCKAIRHRRQCDYIEDYVMECNMRRRYVDTTIDRVSFTVGVGAEQ